MNKLGLRGIYWNFDSNDWQDSMQILSADIDAVGSPPAGNASIPTSESGLGPTTAAGAVLLMHMNSNMGMCALPAIIDRLRYGGWNFVSADQCYGAASLSSTPIPLSAPRPSTLTPWPACTFPDGPIPTDIPTDMNLCATNNGGCAAPTTVCIPTFTNGVNGVSCRCPLGYTYSNATCVDEPNCNFHNGYCSSLVTCTETTGSFKCGPCPAPYVGDGVICGNVTEVLTMGPTWSSAISVCGPSTLISLSLGLIISILLLVV